MTIAHPGNTALLLLLAVCSACGADASRSPAAHAPATPCTPGGDAFLKARLRGALDADVDWSNDAMQCEGGVRPDRSGVRATIAGPLPGADAPRHLRFIFGIDFSDTADGAAQALPTNLTVILEGEQTLFATLGDDKCASEIIERRPLVSAGAGLERLLVRGYCTEPASDASGTRRLLVSTFEFASVINTGESR